MASTSSAKPKKAVALRLPKKQNGPRDVENANAEVLQAAASTSAAAGLLEQPSKKKSEPNPLLMDLVLITLMDMLDLKELKVCRLVCKPWLQHSSKAILNTGHSVNLRNSSLIANFSKDMKKSPYFAFSRFSLGKSLCARVQKHLSDLGSRILHLSIRVPGTGRAAGDLNLSSLHLVLNFMPNLQHLDLQNIQAARADSPDPDQYPLVVLNTLRSIRIQPKFDNGDPYELRRVKTGLRKLFQTAPALESLDIDAENWVLCSIFEYIRSISTLAHIGLRLEYYNYIPRSQDQIDMLRPATYVPRSVRLTGPTWNSNVLLYGFVQKFLGENSGSMERLELISSDQDGTHFILPFMPNLKALLLGGNVTVTSPRHVLNPIPSLRTLELSDPTNESLQLIFKNLQQVENLRLNLTAQHQDLNPLLTGFEHAGWFDESIRRMVGKGVPSREILIFLQLSLGTQSGPSLLSMKRLKTLDLRTSSRTSLTLLLQATLLQMGPLEKLVLENINIWEKFVRVLSKRHRAVSVINGSTHLYKYVEFLPEAFWVEL